MNSSFFLGIVVAVAMYTLLGILFLTVYRKFRFHQENKTMPSPLSPTLYSSSSSSPKGKHQVFPSFHGADVRGNFLSHIMKAFESKAIDVFIDNDIKSNTIGRELADAIRGSRIVLVILSRNYASSSWCLNELVEVIKCREELGKTVMALFYDVDPTDVKKQKGDFGKAFKKTCKGKTEEEIERWRYALAKVAKIAGYHSNKWENEAGMIDEITTDISNKLNISTPASSDFTGLVGMEAHMQKLEPMLCLELDEVRMIGIWGPSGIGKTTIARFLFSKHYESFDLSVFMEDVKGYTRPGCSDEYGLKMHLQQQFLSQIFKQKDIQVPHLVVAQDRLKDKKVLVVLDDVNWSIQLDAMAKETHWFGPGSRIIITTQDKRLLEAHGIKDIYKVKFPLPDEAYQIFCMNAFGQNTPKDGFEVLSYEAMYLDGVHPLGISGMGYKFRGLPKKEWTEAMSKKKWTDVMSKQKWTEALIRLGINLDSDILRNSQIGKRISYEIQKGLLSHISSRMKNYQVKTAAAIIYERSVKEFDEKKSVE